MLAEEAKELAKQQKEAERQQREAERVQREEAKRLELEAKELAKQQKEAERQQRLAEIEREKAIKLAAREQQIAERELAKQRLADEKAMKLAQREAEKAERLEAKRIAEQEREAKRQQREEAKRLRSLELAIAQEQKEVARQEKERAKAERLAEMEANKLAKLEAKQAKEAERLQRLAARAERQNLKLVKMSEREQHLQEKAEKKRLVAEQKAIEKAEQDEYRANLQRNKQRQKETRAREVAQRKAEIEERKAEKKLGVGNIYTDKGIKYVHHLENAVKAKALYVRDDEYVVKNNEIVIVDSFTGRMQPGRRWSEGLHQAIEAKEGVPVQKESRTLASITFQNYFRLYKKLSGMTGTAETSKEEFFKVYGVETYVVPTNKTINRKDHNDQIFKTEAGKMKAIARTVKEISKKGQPVLIGTVSIEKNEMLSEYLNLEGVKHELLNAKNHEREGEIIAQAGKKGSVTIATNMAGRGVDIKLGGNPGSKELYEEIKNIGGLFVLGTERHEARRIDNQLRGRAGRQGDPGETQFFVSLEDPLMRVFAGDTIKSLMSRLGVRDDEPIENKLITRSLENAQTKIEGHNFDSRKHILEYDDILNTQRKAVYERRLSILLGDAENTKEQLGQIMTVDKEYDYEQVRQLMLRTIDMFWMDHLQAMEHTRSSVNLRAYGQRDPLVEYKKEGLRLFRDMQNGINAQIKNIIENIQHGTTRQ
jgi:preprotein translocase subunit SecA